MKTLPYLILIILLIGCKKKTTTPQEVTTTPDPVIKSYRINIRQALYPTTQMGSYTITLSLLVNDTLAIQYKPVSTNTVGIYKDQNTNTIMASVITPTAYFKTGDNFTWRYNIQTTSATGTCDYFIQDLYLTEKASVTEVPFYKMTEQDKIPYINNIAAKDYAFKLP